MHYATTYVYISFIQIFLFWCIQKKNKLQTEAEKTAFLSREKSSITQLETHF